MQATVTILLLVLPDGILFWHTCSPVPKTVLRNIVQLYEFGCPLTSCDTPCILTDHHHCHLAYTSLRDSNQTSLFCVQSARTGLLVVQITFLQAQTSSSTYHGQTEVVPRLQ
ncbi:hypothetical protein DER45DRAFT_548216 [Fusarium avenaceum]|nr:hypothetical protein DER45DRAFT_548216 [Fusarium avenaceum]